MSSYYFLFYCCTASQEKSSVNQGNTTEAKQEEMYEPVDTVSEDESSNFDDLEDFGSTQVSKIHIE